VVQSETGSHNVLYDEIIADAQRQADRLVRRARRESKLMVDKAVSECEQQCQEKREAAAAAAQRQRMLILATVPVEIGRLRAMRAEQELTTLRDAVRDRLTARQDFDYGECLLTLAAEAIRQMEGDAFHLQLAPQDTEKYGPSLAAGAAARAGRPDVKVRIDQQAADIGGGVVVRDPQGRQVWDNSLQARLDRLWPLLRHQMAEYLGLEATRQPEGVVA
jgi:vacuolar-type H+-ATPase subunit E/Vma4